MASIDWSIISPEEFVEVCFHLLRCLGFFDLKYYEGRGDRGRDIVGKTIEETLLIERRVLSWIIQCKHYPNGTVTVGAIRDSLAWAESHQVNRYLLITSGNVSPGVKDYLKGAEAKASLRILTMEKQDLELHIVRNLKDMAPFLPEKIYSQAVKMSSQEVPETFQELQTRMEATHELKALLNDILSADNRVLVVGDIMLDHVLIGDLAPPTLVNPHGEELVIYTSKGGKFENFTPGGAGWMAEALSQLCQVTLIGVLGCDHEASLVKSKLRKNPTVNLKAITTKEIPTIRKQYFVGEGKGELPCVYKLRFDREDADSMTRLVKSQLSSEIETAITETMNRDERIDAIIIDDYEKGVVTPELVRMISELSRKENIPLFVDPKYQWGKFKETPIHTMIPNVREALFGSGLDPKHVEEYEDSDINDVVMYFDKLIDKYPNCRNFVIKADQDGAICISEENKKNRPIDPFIIDAISIDKKDFVTGICCGGVFDAFLTAGIVTVQRRHEKKINMEIIVALANLAAGLRCEKHLGSPVKASEVMEALERPRKLEIPVKLSLHV